MSRLRNLNRSYSRGRVCGTPHTGIAGSLVPAAGVSGAAYTYNDLALPADASKEICGQITTWPTDGVLFANENTSFTFSGAADGIYTFQYQLKVDGVSVGSPATVTLTIGEGAVVSCTVGNAAADGLLAALKRSLTASIGNADAEGATAAINTTGATVIECTVGNASADGSLAGLNRRTTISALVGNAAAAGLNALISDGGAPAVSDLTRYTVAAANRTFAIQATDRRYAVGEANRRLTVAATDRNYTVN